MRILSRFILLPTDTAPIQPAIRHDLLLLTPIVPALNVCSTDRHFIVPINRGDQWVFRPCSESHRYSTTADFVVVRFSPPPILVGTVTVIALRPYATLMPLLVVLPDIFLIFVGTLIESMNPCLNSHILA